MTAGGDAPAFDGGAPTFDEPPLTFDEDPAPAAGVTFEEPATPAPGFDPPGRGSGSGELPTIESGTRGTSSPDPLLFPDSPAAGSSSGAVSDPGAFTEDSVPVPRELPQPVGRDEFPPLDISPEGTPPVAVPADSGFSDNRPAAGTASDDSALPFVEDIDSGESPAVLPDRRDGSLLEFPVDSAPVDSSPQPMPEFDLPRNPDRDLETHTLPDREFGSGGGFDFTPDPIRSPDPRDDLSTRDLPRNFEPNVPRIGSDPASGSLAETRQVSGVMRPNMVLQKTAPRNATVGTPLDYKIYVRNDGDATAYDVVVEDEVVEGATVNGTRPRSVIDRSTNKLIWRFDRIEPGDTEEITVQLTPTGEGTLDGVATVRFKTRVKAATVITAPKLTLQMKGPDEVRLGEEVTYRYVIRNDGSGEARRVFVRTLLPESGGLKHPAGNDLEYEIESVKPGEQREISLSVVAAEPGEYRAEAEVSATGAPKEQAAWRTKIVGAQLKILRRGPKRRFVGRAATFENIVSNETNFDAIDARVVERVPDGMKFLNASSGGRYNETTRSVTWRINRIGPGKQETLQIELMPTESGSRESIVTVFENAGIQSDDHVSTTVVEDLHNVSADITQLDGPVVLGEQFGFTITVDNRGTAEATNVMLEVQVPEELKVVGAGSRTLPARLQNGNLVQYNAVIRIPPNRRQDFELKLQGVRPVRNGVVKASVKYTQMETPLIVSESVTVYEDR